MPVKNPPDDIAQPFRGSQHVVLECRNPDGSLNFDKPQPPVRVMTFDQVYDLFFRDVQVQRTASWSDLRAWLESKSWTVRAKTW